MWQSYMAKKLKNQGMNQMAGLYTEQKSQNGIANKLKLMLRKICYNIPICMRATFINYIGLLGLSINRS